MEAVFLQLLNMSITAGWIVVAVVLLRFLLKKAPRALTVVLWAFVAIRLLCPISFESGLSLIPSAEPVPQSILTSDTPAIHSGIPALNSTVNPILSEALAPQVGDSANPMQVLAFAASVLWIAGMAAMLLYTAISYLRIRRSVREAAPLRENIWLCDHISTPFILGVFRPRIYLPSELAEEDAAYVIAHEQAHLRRRDHLWKPLGFLLLTVYWFHPLLWVAYVLLCRDIEAACDEKVLRTLGEESKKPYSYALIRCSVPRKRIAACPLAFGEVDVKARVKSVLSYKKPAFWIICISAGACIVAAVCLLTNPVKKEHVAPKGKLDLFLERQILNHNRSTDWDTAAFACCDYDVLATETRGNRVTVYLWVLYEEYAFDGSTGSPTQTTGTHIPTVITAETKEGKYRLTEYWIPRDGARYSKDIRKKFPFRLWGTALDSQTYIDKQRAACERKAEQHYGVTMFSYDDNLNGVKIETSAPIYVYDRSVEPIPPKLILSEENQTFQFTYSMFSSYIAVGTYERTEDTLTLHTDDGLYTYVFDIYEVFGTKELWFIFDASRSSPIPEYRYSGDSDETACPVPDGAAFGQIYRTVDDAIFADIDGDGEKEWCIVNIISRGPLENLYNIELAAWTVGSDEYKYHDTIVLSLDEHPWFLSLSMDTTGQLHLSTEKWGAAAEGNYFNVVITDGHFDLVLWKWNN